MSKKQRIAIFCLILLSLGAGSSLGLHAAPNVCEDLTKSQLIFREESKRRLETSRQSLMQFSERLRRVYEELLTHEGKSASGFEVEKTLVVDLSNQLDALSNQFFEYSEKDDQTYQEWAEAHEKCFGQVKAEALNEWFNADVELLTSTAGFLSGFNGLISGWPRQWKELVDQKSLIPEGYFDEVETRVDELKESESLLSESYEVVDGYLSDAQP